MSARAMVQAVFRHKAKMLTVVAAALGCGGAWVATHPPVYRARATLMVEGRGDQASEAAIALLRSGDVQNAAVARLGSHLFPGQAPRDRAEAFARSLEVVSAGPGLVTLSLDARDGRAAAEALSVLIERARTRNDEVFSATGDTSRHALEEQAAAAHGKLATYRSTAGVFDLKAERGALLAHRSDLEGQETTAEAAVAALTDKLATLRRQLAETPATIQLDSESERSHVLEEARSKLFEVQTKEQELLGKYLPSSPFVQSVREEKEQIERMIAHYDAPVESRVENGANPIYQTLQRERLQSESELASAGAKAKAITGQIDEIDRRLSSFAANEKDLALLQQSVADVDAKLAASRAGTSGRTPVTGIAVIEAPQAGARPVGPRPPVIWGLSFAGGIAAALAVAALAQRLSTRFATPADIEGRLGLPVLTSIPREG
ncbi:MAG: hypothetical protein M0006_14855 [Magnetospirillum sp.]|nr:hypothetical protein [Magnetospirillum sp.]